MAKIISPMATGNGAYIVHKTLEKNIAGYQVKGYHPNLTYMPLLLKKAVNPGQADLIHTTPDYACFFTQRNIPTILTFHNYILDSWMTQYSTLLQNIHYKTDLKFFTRIAVSRAHTLTAVSRYTASLARQHLRIKQKINVIYNGIDELLFRPAKRKTGDPIRVLFSGNPTRRKGGNWLAGIAERLNRNISLFYTNGLRNKQIIPETPNLISVGSIPYSDMPVFYNTMDIVLMPTVREGLSLAVLEAMSCGLPIVASDCSSLPEQVIDGKGGFLCPVGEVEAFAEKINILADSPKLRTEMGEYNRAKVEAQFTLKKMIHAYQALFATVLDEK